MFRIGEFTFRVATTPALRDALHRLRYQVYVNEYGYEKPDDHPGGLEKDVYDEHAIALAAQNRQGHVVGGARLIPPRPLVPPALEMAHPWKREKLLKHQPWEVSRFSVSKTFGGQSIGIEAELDKYLSHIGGFTAVSANGKAGDVTDRVAVVLGMIQLVGEVAQAMNVSHLLMATERSLFVFLKRHGLKWDCVGPERDYHGLRAPYALILSDNVPVYLGFRQKVMATLARAYSEPSFSRYQSLAEGESFRLGGLDFSVVTREDVWSDIRALRGVSRPPGWTADVALGLKDDGVTDRHDACSVHLAAKEGGTLVGSARLILNSPMSLPAVRFAGAVHRRAFETTRKAAELSWFALADPYRDMVGSRWPDVVTPGHGARADATARHRRRAALIAVGILRLAYRVSKRLRVTQWWTLLGAPTADLLARHGFVTHVMGPVADAAGRAPRLLRFHEVELKLLDFRNVRALALDLLNPALSRESGARRSNFMEFLSDE